MAALVQGLAELGHRVSLLAPPETKLPGATWIDVPQKVLLGPLDDLVARVPGDADVLHAHYPIQRLPAGIPFLQTMYGNMGSNPVVPPNNVFLSQNHARRHGGTSFVYAGLDPATFTFRSAKADYDLFIGRLHSVKGYRWAIAGARRTGRRLLLAGGWRPSFRRGIRYVGEVDGDRKRELLAGARCLWMPALWDEPFGLTLIEALFSGTPVLGTHRGSLPEIVTPDVGALCDSLEELIEASRTIQSRSAQACRAHALRYFTHVIMAEEYVRCYRHLMATGSLPPGRPTPYTIT
ncbi:MAG TPA: glycosyltransferase [Gemmatimonadales bacterium]|nr:glycosyltransferase [Gemmatimonadales bacterium]